MSIRLNSEFIRGMHFTRPKKHIKPKYDKINTIEAAWVKTGNQMKKALYEYECKITK